MKKGKIIVLVIVLILIAALIAGGIYFATVRLSSKNHGLTSPKLDALPELAADGQEYFVQLSQVNMHYVKYGSGYPVILIHGNAGSADSLKTLARYLANDYSVYCISSRCQGKSSDPGEITYDLMASDVNEFIQALGLSKPFVIGHSDGGIVALSLAANYPDVPGCCVSCGANSRPETFKFYFTLAVKINNLIHPDKLNDLMLTLPDFNQEYLSRITTPTYIIAGEFDIMPLSDSVYICENVKESRLTIVKWANHSSYMRNHPEQIYALVKPFFEQILSNNGDF